MQETPPRSISGPRVWFPAAGFRPLTGAVVAVQVPSVSVSFSPRTDCDASMYCPTATQEPAAGHDTPTKDTSGSAAAAGLSPLRGVVMAAQVPPDWVSIRLWGRRAESQ